MLYPEHDKLAKVAEISQAQGELLEWLTSQGIQRMRWETWSEPVPCTYINHTDSHCSRCRGQQITNEYEDWCFDRRSVTEVLAEFHGIDLAAIEREKGAMLDAVRAAKDDGQDEDG